MSKPTNDATGPADDKPELLQVPVSSISVEDLQVQSGQLQTQPGESRIPWQTLSVPVGHYAILGGLVPRCLRVLEQQQPDQSLGQIGVNVTMAATTGEDGSTVPALLYLFLADGAVYGQSLMTTILDANLRPDPDRLTSVIDSALTEIRRQQTTLAESLVAEPAE